MTPALTVTPPVTIESEWRPLSPPAMVWKPIAPGRQDKIDKLAACAGMAEPEDIMRIPKYLALCALVALGGCASWSQETGVDNRWRGAEVPVWVTGETRAEDVMTALGPPSQIIALKDQVVYYYLKETMAGSAYVLILYNNAKMRAEYDRAIFFFDDGGKLTRYAYSNETLSHRGG